MNRSILTLALSLALSPAYATACNDADAGVACGTNAAAGDPSNVVVGNEAQAVPLAGSGAAQLATAVGGYAQATTQATAVGYFARALGVDSVALGRSAIADQMGTTAVGANAEARGERATAVGRMARSLGPEGVAVGYAATTTGGIAIGTYSNTGTNGSVAFGLLAASEGFGAMSFGQQSVANGGGAIAVGYGANASAYNGLALGAATSVTGSGSVALGAGSAASESGVVSFGAAGRTRRLVNLTAGIADTDGVNVSQLKAIPPAFGGGSTIINGVFVNPIYNLSGGTFNNVGDALTYLDNRFKNISQTPGPAGPQGPQGPAGQNGASGQNGSGAACGEAVCYDDTSRSSVTLNRGGGSTRIGNVAAGVAPTDAVNVSQLHAGISQAVNTSNAYTDQQISELRGDVWRVDRNARGGIAAALAVAGLPQAYVPGARMAAVAASGYRGEAGLAVGISGITDSGRWVYKLAGSSNTAGDFGLSVGAGIQW